MPAIVTLDSESEVAYDARASVSVILQIKHVLQSLSCLMSAAGPRLPPSNNVKPD
jgi:hypothetical protein